MGLRNYRAALEASSSGTSRKEAGGKPDMDLGGLGAVGQGPGGAEICWGTWSLQELSWKQKVRGKPGLEVLRA
jgi:hypothetical protein